jgi:hypothetical protein
MTDDLRIDGADLLGSCLPGDLPWYTEATCSGCGKAFTWPDGAGHDLILFLWSTRTPEEAEARKAEIAAILAEPRTIPLVPGITCW